MILGSGFNIPKDVGIHSTRLFSAPLPLEGVDYQERRTNFQVFDIFIKDTKS